VDESKPLVGGDLQRQSFQSDMIVDSVVFSTSTRSVVTTAALRGIMEARGITPNNCVFIGGGLHSFPFQLNVSSSVHRTT